MCTVGGDLGGGVRDPCGVRRFVTFVNSEINDPKESDSEKSGCWAVGGGAVLSHLEKACSQHMAFGSSAPVRLHVIVSTACDSEGEAKMTLDRVVGVGVQGPWELGWVNVLQCVAVCCSVLQCVAVCCRGRGSWGGSMCCGVLQGVARCCSVLQCVAVCCSVLQYAAVCFRQDLGID